MSSIASRTPAGYATQIYVFFFKNPLKRWMETEAKGVVHNIRRKQDAAVIVCGSPSRINLPASATQKSFHSPERSAASLAPVFRGACAEHLHGLQLRLDLPALIVRRAGILRRVLREFLVRRSLVLEKAGPGADLLELADLVPDLVLERLPALSEVPFGRPPAPGSTPGPLPSGRQTLKRRGAPEVWNQNWPPG